MLSRDKTIHLFEFGDIEYLTKKFGLSGSSGKTISIDIELQFSARMQCQIKCHLTFNLSLCTGRHFCLKCTITSAVAKKPLKDHQQDTLPTVRSLETLQQDFESFTQAGSQLSKAKLHNNVIAKPIFAIPLDQVTI